MRGEQIQRIRDTGCAGVGESRGLHFRRALPAGFCFDRIRRRHFLKVKLVDSVALSTFGLVMKRLTTHLSRQSKSLPWGGADHEARVLHDADPSSREGLAAIPER